MYICSFSLSRPLPLSYSLTLCMRLKEWVGECRHIVFLGKSVCEHLSLSLVFPPICLCTCLCMSVWVRKGKKLLNVNSITLMLYTYSRYSLCSVFVLFQWSLNVCRACFSICVLSFWTIYNYIFVYEFEILSNFLFCFSFVVFFYIKLME